MSWDASRALMYFGRWQIIRKMNHSALIAASGAEGVKLLKKNAVDFVITQFPGEIRMVNVDARIDQILDYFHDHTVGVEGDKKV